MTKMSLWTFKSLSFPTPCCNNLIRLLKSLLLKCQNIVSHSLLCLLKLKIRQNFRNLILFSLFAVDKLRHAGQSKTPRCRWTWRSLLSPFQDFINSAPTIRRDGIILLWFCFMVHEIKFPSSSHNKHVAFADSSSYFCKPVFILISY